MSATAFDPFVLVLLLVLVFTLRHFVLSGRLNLLSGRSSGPPLPLGGEGWGEGVAEVVDRGIPRYRVSVHAQFLRRQFSLILFLPLTFPLPLRAAPTPPDSTLPSVRGFIESYRSDREALERQYPVAVSSDRFARLQQFRDDQLAALRRIDFAALDIDGQVDYLLLQNQLQADSREAADQRRRLAETTALVPFIDSLVAVVGQPRGVEGREPTRDARTLTDLRAAIVTVKKDLQARHETKQGPGPVLARRAAQTVDTLRRHLGEWNEFYAGYDPEFTWWLREPQARLDKELESYAGFLRTNLAGYTDGEDEPVIGDPIGAPGLADALVAEMIPYSAEELIEIARQEFAWCDREMMRAARDLGCGDDWSKALDKVSQLHVRPGEQPQLIRQLADESIRFLEERQLITIPELCKEAWRLEMMTPERQKMTPYFTGGEVVSVSFPTDTMAHEDKLMSLRGNNIHFCRATLHHELIPGHHLQLFMADRYRTHRKIFRTPFFIEGWPLYWELRLWELGFARSAEDRVGMLFWRAHRCARIIFSLNFHLGKMSAQEAIDFLVARVGHERRNATAEVRRSVSGDYAPLYQAAYLLGGLQLRALHREVVESGRMTERDFHDALLRENAIPVELLRAKLTRQQLGPDWRASWRFYQAPKP